MIQQIIISILFISAALYLGRALYRSFQAKNTCESGCGKCGVAELEKVKKTIG
jgi:FeoB-associated Cys-rich membrane protein